MPWSTITIDVFMYQPEMISITIQYNYLNCFIRLLILVLCVIKYSIVYHLSWSTFTIHVLYNTVKYLC